MRDTALVVGASRDIGAAIAHRLASDGGGLGLHRGRDADLRRLCLRPGVPHAFAREYHIGRYWTETRLGRLAPVNNEMVLNYIAERELGLPRSY